MVERPQEHVSSHTGVPSELRQEYISVYIDPQKVPEPEPCPLCCSSMAKTLLTYEFRDPGARVVVTNTEPIPGYRCEKCDAEYFDSSAGLLLDKETFKKLGPASRLKGPLHESAKRLAERLGQKPPGTRTR